MAEFWPMTLEALTPKQLRQWLDEAGIKNRVISVSACYGWLGNQTPFGAVAGALAGAVSVPSGLRQAHAQACAAESRALEN